MDKLHALAREVAKLRMIATEIDEYEADLPSVLVGQFHEVSAEVCDIADDVCVERGLLPAKEA